MAALKRDNYIENKVAPKLDNNHMGKKRQKEDRLEMLEPLDKRGKEMWGFRNAGRGRIKQGGHGGYPPHHKKRGRFCRRIPAECYPGDWQLRKGTAARRIHRQDKSQTGRDGCPDRGERKDRCLYAGV